MFPQQPADGGRLHEPFLISNSKVSYLGVLHVILRGLVKVQLLPCGLPLSPSVSECESTCRFLLNSVRKTLSHPEAQLSPCLHCLCALLFTRSFPVQNHLCVCVCADRMTCVCVCWYVQGLVWVCINSTVGRDRGLQHS